MNTPGAILVEDEPLVRAEIRELLHRLWPELSVCAEVGDGAQALAALEHHRPQVVFLDIQMPGMDGLEVARRIAGRAHVVFISAYDQHAVAAFERGALDYVVKPVSAQRLALTVERLRERVREPPPDLQGIAQLLRQLGQAESSFLKWLTVPHGEELRVIATSEICFLRADNKYTEVVTPSEAFLITATLRRMREVLDPAIFWQIHRSVLVNVAAIASVHRSFRGALEVKLKRRGEVLPVSSSYAHRFRVPAR